MLITWASQQWAAGAGGPPVQAAQTVVTDTSTTPTTVALTLGAQMTGVRVWLGDGLSTETDFFLYVKRNATTYKIKCYRNSAPIIVGVAGDTFAFGTTDGRTIYVTPMITPAALITSFPVSGTANADKAGPPLWTPTAAHVTLADFNSAISLAADAGQRVVFISEYDPVGEAWTPARAIMLHPSRASVVQCTYKQIALANYGGATVSVSAPTGAVIGGTSAQMHLTFPGGTGTLRAVTTVANFKTAMAAAVSGDIIELAAGTYALDVAITNATFAANGNSAKGILIRGATGIRSDVVITGNISGTNGNWTLTGGPSAAEPIMFKDLTFNWAGTTGVAFTHNTGGYGLYENVRCTGVGSLDSFLFNNTSTAVILDAMWCSFDNSAGDCVNGAGTAGQNAASRVRFIGCDTELPVDLAAGQGVTSHTGLAVWVFGGTHKSANTNAIAPDAATTPLYVFYARLEKGTRRAGFSNVRIMYGCYADVTATVTIGANTLWKGNYLVGDGSTVIRSALANSQIEGNYIKWASGAVRGFHNSNTTGDVAGVIFNVFDGFPEGARFMDSASAGGTVRSTNNTYANDTTGLNLQDNNLLVINKNNAVFTATTGVNCTATSMPNITTNYNTIDPTIDADFVAGANDIVNANAGLDSNLFPTASGNCDGNGDATLFDWIGGRDCYGFAVIYLPTRVSRGGRERAVIHTSAVLFPAVQ